MDKVIISDCPICSKSCRAIDKKEDANCDDLKRCDYNESYICYQSESNPNLRFLARRSKPHKYNFPK